MSNYDAPENNIELEQNNVKNNVAKMRKEKSTVFDEVLYSVFVQAPKAINSAAHFTLMVAHATAYMSSRYNLFAR